MEFSKLNLGQASLIKKEVDLAIHKLNELATFQSSSSLNGQNNEETGNSNSNPIQQMNYQNYKQKLLSSIQSRIDQLEQFYLNNSDDDRAVLFEKERLRLRKAFTNLLNHPTTVLQSVPSSAAAGAAGARGGETGSASSVNKLNESRSFHSSMTGGPGGGGGVGGNINRSLSQSIEQQEGSGNNPQQQQPQPQPQTRGSSNLSVNLTRSISSIQNTPTQLLSTTRKSPGSPQQIYAWEERSEKPNRITVTVDDGVFEPTTRPGFYKRIGNAKNGAPNSPGSNLDDEPVNLEEDDEEEDDGKGGERYYDFQIVLTQDEITALAARRRKEREDVKLLKSTAAATSIHTTVPYIDPRRIVLETYRPGHPDRWIHPDGMKYTS